MLIGKTNRTRKIREMLLDSVRGKISVLKMTSVVIVLGLEEVVPIAHVLGFAKMRPSWSAKDCHVLELVVTDHSV